MEPTKPVMARRVSLVDRISKSSLAASNVDLRVVSDRHITRQVAVALESHFKATEEDHPEDNLVERRVDFVVMPTKDWHRILHAINADATPEEKIKKLVDLVNED